MSFANGLSITTPMGGAKGGAIIGVFYAGSFDFNILGTFNVLTLTGAITDIVVYTFMAALACAVAGWWLGRN
jgi:hypothetical protein